MTTTTTERLPRSVVPSAYRLRVEPDLDAASFTGTVEIDVEMPGPVPSIVLHAHQLELETPVLRDADGKSEVGTATLDPEHQRAVLAFATEVGPGIGTLSIAFKGVLNDELAGFYRSTFEDEAGRTRTIATTQFEMTDARRAFPCFDEPAFKATFEVTLVVPEEMAAFSNSAPAEERALEDGRREIRFVRTMKMSTYLVAYVVGPFEQTAARDVEGVPLRVVYRAGKEQLTAFALDIGEFSLRCFREYFGIPYPGDKVDLLAIPDFAAGAMENLGCVTFREVELLADPATASQNELVRVAMVVAHELAHMWFGDLVTMEWWEGLWLNEAFATFMQYVCVDRFRPDWDMWARFAGERETGMVLDSVHTTRPIEFPVRSPQEAMAMADPITYQKGSSVLRMLEQYLSPDVFREGIRHYLQAHAYGNTVTEDLWASLEAVSDRPVREIMSSWLYQGGHPIVTVSASSLAQRPFTLGPAAGDSAIGDRWLVPIVERTLTTGHTSARLLAEASEPFEADAATFLNAGGAGVYRTNYSPAQLQAVIEHLAVLTEVERSVLVGDTIALAYAGERRVADVLAIASRLGTAVEPRVWETLDRMLDFLDRAVTADQRPLLAAKVRALMGPLFAELGWTPVLGEDERTNVLRATVVRRLGTTGEDADVRAEAVRRFERGELEGDLAVPVLAVVASLNRTGDYDEFVRRFKAAEDPQVERRYQQALTLFTDREMVLRAYDEVFDTFRAQDAPMVLYQLMANRVGGLAVWSAVTQDWDATAERVPAMLHATLGLGLLFQVGDLDAVEKATEFHRGHVLPAGQRMIEQALEWFAASSRLALRERPTLGTALA